MLSCMTTDWTALTDEFTARGYAVAKQLFGADEVDLLNRHFEDIHREQPAGHYHHASHEEAAGDMLAEYPRVMNPHRFSDTARRFLTDNRMATLLGAFFGEEPLGVQTMFYYKPPGSRGQKMHQDQFYLQVAPGTCIAAWVALDYVDMRNGGLIVVPFTNTMNIDCRNVGKPGSYDPDGTAIPVPAGYHGESPVLEPGDTLFFNGSLIHGSGSNKTAERWRRSFICHYVGESCKTISKFYHPLVRMDGTDVEREETTAGGPCGAFVGAAH